jgi:glycerol-3-phosphate O-acyltransferase
MVGSTADVSSTSKPPREVLNGIVASAGFEQRVRSLAADSGRPLDEVRAEAVACLKEMTAGESRSAVAAWTRAGQWMARAYAVDASTDSLQRLRELNRRFPLVFLPNHRSYLDPFVLRSVLAPAGFPPNHVLGGANLSFFPLGPIARRNNLVFIRREFKNDPVYRAMLGEYLGHLVRDGANLEWYIEGGRTRTGKLRPPRMGILSYLLDAFESSGVEDLMFVPVSVIYDQQAEVGAIAAEESGGTKAPESISWLVDYARAQSVRRGKAYLRFAEPVSLRETWAASRQAAGSDDIRKAVPRVAIEVCHRINEVTPITAPALVTLTLLDNDDRALTEAQMRAAVLPVAQYVKARGLPVASGLNLETIDILHERSPSEGLRALRTLVREGVVAEYKGGLEPVYRIPRERQLEAAFYRNTLSHFFVTRSIVELALVRAAELAEPDLVAAVWEGSLRLRDLLKFEFFFSSKREFDAEVRAEAEIAFPGWDESSLATAEVMDALRDAPFVLAHRILGPFIEAYAVLAERLAAADPSAPVDQDALIAESVGVAQQKVLQRTLRSPESVSKDLFRGAVKLADNRGLLEPGEAEVARRRAAFATEMDDAVRRVAVLRAIAADKEP